MPERPCRVGLACIMLLAALPCLGTPAQAQLPTTQLRTVFPPGGQAGTSFSVEVVEGDDLDELSGLIFNHPGIRQTDQPDPLTNPRKFSITIDSNVLPGFYSVRAQGRFGVSNSRMFRVETDPARPVLEAELQKESPFPVQCNSVIYSRIDSAGDIDEFAVDLVPNHPYTLSVESLALDSRLLPVVEIYNPRGRRMAFARRVEEQDPRLDFSVTEAGTYRIRITDFLYKGAINYAYRLHLTDQPLPLTLISSASPDATTVTVLKPVVTGGEAEIPARVEALDQQSPRVLPGYVSPRRSLSDQKIAAIRLGEQPPVVTALPMASQPLQIEQEPNNLPSQAQVLTLPVELVGRLANDDEADVYSIAAKKGEVLWLQVLGERDGQQLDPLVLLEQVSVDAAGKETVKPVAIPDDLASNLYPNVFDTLSDDVDFRLAVPEDTTYRLTIRNRYQLSPDIALARYRLRIAPPRPDFQAVALTLPPVAGNITADTPAGCVLRQGGTATLKILLDRQQGFDKPVLVTAASSRPGIVFDPLILPPGIASGNLILRASADAAPGPAEIQLTATAVDANDTSVRLEEFPARQVLAADIVWKAETVYPAVSRLGHAILVSVIPETLPARLSAVESPVIRHVTQGEQVWHPWSLQRHGAFNDKVTLTVEGIDNNAKIAIAAPEFAKDQQTAAARIHFLPDSREGWHVGNVKFSATFNHVRNPELIARQEAAHQQKEQAASGKKAELAATTAKLEQSRKSAEAAKQELATLTPRIEELKKQVTLLDPMIDEAKKGLEAETDEALKAERQAALDKLNQQRMEQTRQLEATQAKLDSARQLSEKLAGEIDLLGKEQTRLTQEATNLDKELATTKQALDKVRNDQKPKPLKHDAFVENLVFFVHKAPFKLTLKSPAEMSINKGESVEATVEMMRTAGVTGPVQFTLTTPPGVTGLATDTVTLSDEQNTAVLKISAGAEATSGKHAFCTLRGTIQHEGHSLSVDLPVTINIP
ncbi:MAG: hypothetical protein KDA76_11425 [Planctomycetaceae bacterium]|nr:hypothetical protein [Planctomycetaceae bacterium]